MERLRGRLREGIAAEGILGTLIDSIEEFERFEEEFLEKGRFEDWRCGAAEGVLGTLIDSIEDFERLEEALLEMRWLEDWRCGRDTACFGTWTRTICEANVGWCIASSRCDFDEQSTTASLTSACACNAETRLGEAVAFKIKAAR